MCLHLLQPSELHRSLLAQLLRQLVLDSSACRRPPAHPPAFHISRSLQHHGRGGHADHCPLLWQQAQQGVAAGAGHGRHRALLLPGKQSWDCVQCSSVQLCRMLRHKGVGLCSTAHSVPLLPRPPRCSCHRLKVRASTASSNGLVAEPGPVPLRVLWNIPSRTPCRALPQLLPHSHPARADIWWVSALGTASSLLYVFIALILGLIYSGNHLGSVGGRVGSSTSQKIFGIFSSLGNIAFAFGGWRGSACGWLLASKLAVCAAVGSQEPTVLPVYRAKCGIIPFHLARACRRLCPGAARDPGHASPAARCPENNEEGGPRASAVQPDEQVSMRHTAV